MRYFNRNYRILKKMNLIKDQQGIVDRFLKEKEGWSSHIQKSQKYISNFIKNKKGNIAVLGSGWLLDVPIEELSEQFDKVYLIDLYHPAQIRHRVKQFKNVVCIESDITGGLINEIYIMSRQSKKKKVNPDITKLLIPKYDININVQSLISINILNQLDTLLVEYLEKHLQVEEEKMVTFRKSIQQQHLNFLKTKESCLITDFEEWVFDANTNNISTKKLVHIDLPNNVSTKYWDWLFDMTGSYNIGKSTILKVVATTM